MSGIPRGRDKDKHTRGFSYCTRRDEMPLRLLHHDIEREISPAPLQKQENSLGFQRRPRGYYSLDPVRAHTRSGGIMWGNDAAKFGRKLRRRILKFPPLRLYRRETYSFAALASIASGLRKCCIWCFDKEESKLCAKDAFSGNPQACASVHSRSGSRICAAGLGNAHCWRCRFSETLLL